jgi:hypothetical protein
MKKYYRIIYTIIALLSIQTAIAQPVTKTLAGSGASGDSDGIGTAASFYRPGGVAVDASGDVYVGDSGNQKIRKIIAHIIMFPFL